MNIFKIVALIVISILFYRCDPGHSGDTILHNQTAYSLNLSFKSGSTDTSMTIQPYSTTEIYRFGGLGSGSDYNCCPCEFKEITLVVADTSKSITKSVTDSANWLMLNPNEKRFSTEKIICNFLLEPKDIQ